MSANKLKIAAALSGALLLSGPAMAQMAPSDRTVDPKTSGEVNSSQPGTAGAPTYQGNTGQNRNQSEGGGAAGSGGGAGGGGGGSGGGASGGSGGSGGGGSGGGSGGGGGGSN
jgi:hypothetical protein